MASPTPSNTALDNPTITTGIASKPAQEDITFKFCRECSNMLYPKEDRMTSRLMFACRTCQFSEEAQSSCVFRNTIHNTAGEIAGVTQDVGSDPTVRDGDLLVVAAVDVAPVDVAPVDVDAKVNVNVNGVRVSGEGKGAESGVEEICCTLCGGQIEWSCVLCGEELEIMELQVGPGGVPFVEGEGIDMGVGDSGHRLSLEELSRMEDEDEDMDGEEDTTGDDFLCEGEGAGMKAS